MSADTCYLRYIFLYYLGQEHKSGTCLQVHVGTSLKLHGRDRGIKVLSETQLFFCKHIMIAIIPNCLFDFYAAINVIQWLYLGGVRSHLYSGAMIIFPF